MLIWTWGLASCLLGSRPTDLAASPDPLYYNSKGSGLKQNVLPPFKGLDLLNYEFLIGREWMVSGSDEGLLPQEDH